jgi:hypothetical protein
MRINSKFIIITIFISIFFSVLYANFNIKNYDKNIINKNGSSVHILIKDDSFRYFSHGYEIKQQLKNNVDYFETGRPNFTKYLYPRIIALYYLVFDYNLYDNIENKVVNIGVHKNFLYFQILLYYLSVLFLYTQIRKEIDNKYLFFSVLFLCLEPTIFQYHVSFWSESIFFSFQILIMGFVLSKNYSNFRLFLLGILLAFLALQRTNGFYYFIPLLFYFYFIKKFDFFKKTPMIALGFILITSLVGYHNLKKSGKFFIVPLEAKAALFAYVVPNILDKKNLEMERDNILDLVEEKNIIYEDKDLSKLPYSQLGFTFCLRFNSLETNPKYLEMCDYINKRAKILIITKPLNTLKFFIKSSLSFSVLNPFHVFTDNKFNQDSKFYLSETQVKLKKYRIFYSLIIYLICFFGLIKIMKSENKQLLLFTILSSLYFFLILSWHGNNRYFVPVLIYLSILFGYGANSVLSFFIKSKIN